MASTVEKGNPLPTYYDAVRSGEAVPETSVRNARNAHELCDLCVLKFDVKTMSKLVNSINVKLDTVTDLIIKSENRIRNNYQVSELQEQNQNLGDLVVQAEGRTNCIYTCNFWLCVYTMFLLTALFLPLIVNALK